MIMTVLKSFPYAADGRHVNLLLEGSTADIRPELVSGLIEAGLIEPRGPLATAQAAIAGAVAPTTAVRRR